MLKEVTLFERVEPAPPDPILGLTEAFRADSNPDKIDLSVGVYKDASNQTPVLKTVKQAEHQVLAHETSKNYLPIDGTDAYGHCVRRLMFGADSDLVDSGLATTSDTPGGTGALRVAGDYLHQSHPEATVWLSDPTWANHPAIFEAAGVPIKTYPYLDRQTNALAFDPMMATLAKVPVGDMVLLHGCCHNPTGVDPTADQWLAIGRQLVACGITPLLDFAYQGFADSLDSDAVGLHALYESCPEMLVCSSFSKNFGLYRERVGSLTVVSRNAQTTAAVQSRIKVGIRRNYSNPPSHGAAIVQTILGDGELTQQWHGELTQMRDRITGMRQLFADSLDHRSVQLNPDGNAFITRQRGMFSFSGLTKDQVGQLRQKHSIYIVGSGRINVAGMTGQNMDRLCDAIASVM